MDKPYPTGAQNKNKKFPSDPIRSIQDIKSITKFLESSPRDYLLWLMGINNGLRASDLVRIKYGQVKKLKIGKAVKIIESKTGKENVLVINKSVYKAIQFYVNAITPGSSDYLFFSRKGKGHISSQTVGRMIRSWTKALHLPGRYGAHTLRKTWGYHQRVTYGVGFEIICKRYNHSSPAVTMGYLGIEDKEVVNVCMNEIG